MTLLCDISSVKICNRRYKTISQGYVIGLGAA